MSYLSHGSKGEQVVKLQTALNRAGYSLAVDGVFGNATARAVRLFQVDNGLKADGLAGPATKEALTPYMQDYTLVAKALEECTQAIEKLPEYKKLEALIYG